MFYNYYNWGIQARVKRNDLDFGLNNYVISKIPLKKKIIVVIAATYYFSD